jgi:amino acid permease
MSSNEEKEPLISITNRVNIKPSIIVEGVPENTPSQVMFLVLNSIIGTGLFSQSYVFSVAGIWSTIVLYIVCGIALVCSSNLLIKCCNYLSIYDFGIIVQETLGDDMKFVFLCALVLNSFYNVITLLVILGDSLSDVIIYIINMSDWYTTAYFLLPFSVLFAIFPLSLPKYFGDYVSVSYVAVFANILIFAVVVVNFGETKLSNKDDYLTFSFYGTVDSVGTVLFSLTFLYAILPAYTSMVPQSPKIMTRISNVSLLISAGMGFMIGLLGYLTYASDTEESILDNFKSWHAFVIKIFIIGQYIFIIPLDFWLGRNAIEQLFEMKSPVGARLHFNVTLSLYCFLGAIAAYLCWNTEDNGLNRVVYFLGGYGQVMVNLIFPGLLALNIFSDHYKESIYGTMLIVFGVIVIVTMLYNLLS